MDRVEILAVGSELLTPFHLDTDSLFLAERLNDLGLEVAFKTVAGDREEDLLLVLDAALRRSDLIFVVGGLGPTADDLTRDAVARCLRRSLIPDPKILDRIEERFSRRGLVMPASNRKQALILEGAEVLTNDFGSAPGQWLEHGEKILVLLPGPPQELRPMVDRYVLPRLERHRKGALLRKVLKIAGLTESALEDLMADLYPRDPCLGITTLARPGEIELHLRARSPHNLEDAGSRLEPLLQALRSRLGDHIFSTEGESLEAVVGRLLRLRRRTVACAESCTGGFLSHRLTNIPGSSDYFLGGMIVYANGLKETWLGVPKTVLLESGAVSARTAEALAVGVRRAASADFGLAVTGIAGPGGRSGSFTRPSHGKAAPRNPGRSSWATGNRSNSNPANGPWTCCGAAS